MKRRSFSKKRKEKVEERLKAEAEFEIKQR